MLAWIHLPVIASLFLFSWCEVAVSFPIHIGDSFLVLIAASHWVEDVFGVFETLGWNTIFDVAAVCVLGPLIFSGETLTEGLSLMGVVLLFFNVVELIGETLQRLSLEYLASSFRSISRFTIGEGRWEWFWIVSVSRVHLDNTWLIYLGFAVLLQMWRS